MFTERKLAFMLVLQGCFGFGIFLAGVTEL